MSTTDPRINERITAPQCRLVDEDGEQLGIFATREAMQIAWDKDLDLVEVAPGAAPPVCRIMDFGKFKYEAAIKAKKARKHQTKIEIKEIKFRPKIDKADFETKKKHVMRFLDAGAKVKITIMFRGREMVHPELGLKILDRLAADLGELAVIENEPKQEGRNVFMLIAPNKALERRREKEAAEAAAAEEAAEAGAAAEAVVEAPAETAPAAEQEAEPAAEAAPAAEEAAEKPAAETAPADEDTEA